MKRVKIPSIVLSINLVLTFTLVFLLSSNYLSAATPSFQELKTKAEKLYAEGSYQLAREVYEKVEIDKLSEDDSRWVRFRLADTLWRSKISMDKPPKTVMNRARKDLEELLTEMMRDGRKDSFWARVEVSMAGSWWLDWEYQEEWKKAWPHYKKVLDWCASSTDIEQARREYLKVIRQICEPFFFDSNKYCDKTYWSEGLPDSIFDDAVRIAVKPQDRALFGFMSAIKHMKDDPLSPSTYEDIEGNLEKAVNNGKGTKWYPEAVCKLADWYGEGRWVIDDGQKYLKGPNLSKALRCYDKLLKEPSYKESEYYEDAEGERKTLTRKRLHVSTGGSYEKGSIIDIETTWKGTENINYGLYEIDLSSAKLLDDLGEDTYSNFPYSTLEKINMSKYKRIEQWSRRGSLPGDMDMYTHKDHISLNHTLPPGVYVLEASSGELVSRSMIVVTNIAMLGKCRDRSVSFYLCNIRTGSPVKGVAVKLYLVNRERTLNKVTDGNGMVEFTLPEGQRFKMIAFAAKGRMQNYCIPENWGSPSEYNLGSEKPRILTCVFTDRPAYRPGETVRMKVIARERSTGKMRIPSNRDLYFEINSEANGTLARKGKFELGKFGSAWDSFKLSRSLPLGEYNIIVSQHPIKHQPGKYYYNQTIFRLEEYKLPEFRVHVDIPEAKKRAIQPGDEVKVEISGEYYSGENLTGGEVNIQIYGQKLSYYDLSPVILTSTEDRPRISYNYPEKMVDKKMFLDKSGHASYVFRIPNVKEPRVYLFEADVSDASRRMVSGSTTMRVSKRKSWVCFKTGHQLYKKGAAIKVDVKSMDVRGNPVPETGRIRVERQTFGEIWMDPSGNEVSGKRLERLQWEGNFPPERKGPCYRGWHLKKAHSRNLEAILSKALTTDEEGRASFSFTPARAGSYIISWQKKGKEDSLEEEKKEVWVVQNEMTDTSMSDGTLKLVQDRKKVKPGETEKLLVIGPVKNSSIWLTESRMTGKRRKIIHVKGIGQVLEYKVNSNDYPGIYLSFTCVHNGEVFRKYCNIKVSADEHKLEVNLSTDREKYSPGEIAHVKIKTSDFNGNPLSAEVGLGVADKAIYKIEEDPIKDIFKEFYPHYNLLMFGFEMPCSSIGYDGCVMNSEEDSEPGLQIVKTGQEGSGDRKSVPALKGFVSDEEGDPIRGATLVAFDDKNQKGYSGKTDAQGRYFIPLPEKRKYEIRLIAEATGYGTVEFSRIDAPEDCQVSLSFQLFPVETVNAEGGRTPKVKSITSKMVKCRYNGQYFAALDGNPSMAGAVDKRVDANLTIPPPPFPGMKDILYLAPGALSNDRVEVRVRNDFRSTAFWKPDLVTGEDGTAEVQFKVPDGLTTWKATARAATVGNDFGQVTGDFRTTQNLTVRLEAPRFFIVKDRATVSSVITNNGGEDIKVQSEMRVNGLKSLGMSNGKNGGELLDVPAGTQKRVDWLVEAEHKGKAIITVLASGKAASDAMRREYPVYEHGMKKLAGTAGKIKGKSGVFTINLPRERKEGTTEMKIDVTPSLAFSMLNALPYLIQYPYGCTEQTMSRFVPAVVTVKTLNQLGLEKVDITGRIFGGIEQASADTTHPEGKKSLGELDKIVKNGLLRIYGLRTRDDGWSWWGDSNSNDPYMTAYVVWGLSLAADNGIEVDKQVLKKAYEYLLEDLSKKEKEPFIQAWMLFAVSSGYHLQNYAEGQVPPKAIKTLNILWQEKNDLNTYSKALLALSAYKLGDEEKAQVLVRNLANGVIRDKNSGNSILIGREKDTGTKSVDYSTAHWGSRNFWWHWYDSPVETTAFALRAILAVDSKNPLVEPAVNWLVKNRRGAQWSSTKDTAIAILALDKFLETSGELSGKSPYKVLVNGNKVADRVIDRGNILATDPSIKVPVKILRSGRNTIKVVKTSGDGPLFFSATASYFSLEDPIKPEGNQIFISRRYFRVSPENTLLQGVKYKKTPIKENDIVQSGDYIECVLTFEAKNDYEYLILEDYKPAGFEALEQLSGKPFYTKRIIDDAAQSIDRLDSDYTGEYEPVHEELRDRKVAFFIDNLDQGFWEIRYELRAEVPGKFHALPATAAAMYVPEIRANSSEEHVKIKDREKH